MGIVVHAVAREQIEPLGEGVEHGLALLEHVALDGHHRAIDLCGVGSVCQDHAATHVGLQHVVQRHLQGFIRGALDSLYVGTKKNKQK